VRGHVWGDVRLAGGAGGANCCGDCDGYRPDTLGGGIGQARFPFGVMGTRKRGQNLFSGLSSQPKRSVLLATVSIRLIWPVARSMVSVPVI